jgi:predicted DNA-binding transcriptional regulator AlpA
MNKIARPYVTSRPVSLTETGRHLNISLPMVQPIMATMGARALPGGRYDLADVWRRMWGIDRVPLAWIESMKRPLLSVETVAEMVGSHPATIRRAGNERSTKWCLPEHFDLGPRLRKYLPLHIEAWMRGEEPAEWLRRRHGPVGPLGLRLKRAVDAQDGGAMSD